MRTFPYLLLAYVALGLQLGIGRYTRWHGAEPNLVLLAAVFVALNAPRDAAVVGCVVLGLCQDLLSAQPLGLFGVSYGLAAMVVASSAGVVERNHPLTHVSLTLVAGAVTAVVILAHELLRPIPVPARAAAAGPGVGPMRESVLTLGVGVLYTAALSPVVLGLLSRGRRVFGFQAPKRASLGVRR